jgi:hypothetical protein
MATGFKLNSHPGTKVPDMRITPRPARKIDPFGFHDRPSKGKTEDIYQGHDRNLPDLNEFGNTRKSNDHTKPQVKAQRGQ